MGQIASELTTFKSTVEPGIGKMSSTCTTIIDKVSELSTSATSARSGIDSCYNSSRKNSVMNKLSKVNTICTNISTSVSGDLVGTISEAEALIALIGELEKINEEIEAQEAIISSNSGDTPEAINKRNGAQSIINQKNTEFDQKHNDAKTKLTALKSKDSSLDVEFVPVSAEPDIDKLKYGSFEKREFTASNGLTIKYWLYVPDYGEDVEGLPCMLYMHGGSTHQTVSYEKGVQYGLGSKLANKEITPSGVVIVPCVEDFTDKGIVALKELTDEVVDEQKCNQDRVSVSGHSYGGITSYKLINKYPGYFSCCVPISGRSEVTDAFKDVKVWSFNGTAEGSSSWTSYNSSVAAVDEINKIGGQATLTPLKTGHAGTNKVTYEKEYLSPDGIMENPIEWAFRQERA